MTLFDRVFGGNDYNYTRTVAAIDEAIAKPVCAIDEENKPKAYVRIKDENILASPVHLKVWQHSNKKRGAFVAFTEKEQRLLYAMKGKMRPWMLIVGILAALTLLLSMQSSRCII